MTTLTLEDFECIHIVFAERDFDGILWVQEIATSLKVDMIIQEIRNNKIIEITRHETK